MSHKPCSYRTRHLSLHRTKRALALAGASQLVVAAFFGLGDDRAAGANVTWDIVPGTVGTGDGTITDGTGSWDNATGNFTTNGGSTNFAWDNTANAGDTAVFGASQAGTTTAVTGGTVTLVSAGITAGGISEVGNDYASRYTLTGGTLTFSTSVATISLSSGSFGSALTISSPIAGNAVNLAATSYNNYAYLTLNGSNTYAGGTTVSGPMVLTVGNAAAFGTGSVNVTGFYSSVANSVALTLPNNFTLGQTFTFNATNALTLSGVISGTGNFYKSGASDLTLAGSNTYTGGTTLNTGAIRLLSTNSAFGTGSVLVNTSTTNGVVTNTIATQSGSTGVTIPNNITVTNNGTGTTTLAFDAGYGSITLTGTVSGTGSVAKASSGNLYFNSTNTYSGTTTIGGTGTLILNSATASFGTGNVSIANTATLNIGRGGVISNNISGGGAVYSVNGGYTLAGTDSFTGSIYTGAGAITLPAGFSTNLSATSQLILGYSSGYTTEVVNNATVADASASPIVLRGNGELTNNSATGLTMSGSVTTINTLDTNAKLLTLRGTGIGTYSGPIGGGTGGAINVLKTQAGTWIITGTNTSTGTNAISAGVLQANNTTSSLGSGATAVTSTGVLAGTGTLGTSAVSIGTSTAGAGGTITGGTGATPSDTIGTLTSTGTEAWNASGTYAVKINGAASDELVLSGLTAAATGFTVQVTGTTGSAFTVGKTYIIADVTTGTSSTFNSTVTNAFNLTTAGSAVGYTFGFGETGDGNNGEELLLNVTPEPASLSLIALGAPLLLKRRRRSR